MNDVLPPDDELVHRENVFLSLFDKYNVDEGSDPELIDEMDDVIDDIDPDSSLSEKSTTETEDSYDMMEMNQQLQPIIKDRVNAWPEKGIHFQIQTIDRGVSVEEWLMANQEFITTTKKSKTTVINEPNKTTTVTTETTRTTTTRKSINVIRNQANNGSQVKAITDGEFIANSSKERIEIPNQGLFADGLISSSKKFSCLSKPGKQSTLNVNQNVGRQNKVASPIKFKQLSPQKMRNLRNRIKSIPTEAEKMQSLSEIVPNEIAGGLDREDVADNTKHVQEQQRNGKTSNSKKVKRLSPRKKRNQKKLLPTEAEKINANSEVVASNEIVGALDSEMVYDKPVQEEPQNPKTGNFKEVKRLSPQKKRNGKKLLPTEAEKINANPEVVASNEIVGALDSEMVYDKPVQDEPQNPKTGNSKEVKRLSPQKKRNRKKLLPTEAEKINANPEVVASNEIVGALDSEMVYDKPAQEEPQNPKTGNSKEVKRLSPQKKRNRKKLLPTEAEKINTHSEVVASNETIGALNSDMVLEIPVREEPRNPKPGNSNKANVVLKSRPEVVIYSANSGEEFGTKIDNEFISVGMKDIEKRIDSKYRRQHIINLMKNCIVPVDQSIVYAPPMNDTTMQNNSNDDSESDDELLTSYTRTGHLCRLVYK